MKANFWARTLLTFAIALTAAAQGRTEMKALPASRAVVLVLAPGLTLEDLQGRDTPDLHRLTQESALGLMPTRAGSSDALAPYRALASGSRSPSAGSPALGQALRAGGVRTTAVGGAGAAVVAGVSGVIPTGRQSIAEAPYGRATDPEALAREVSAALRGDTPVFVAVEFADVADTDAYAPYALPAATARQRREALERLDTLVARLQEGSREAALLLAAPSPSLAAAARRERAGPILFRPVGTVETPPLLLTSPSTRGTPGLVANTDIASTVTALLGVRASVGAGRPIVAVPVPEGQERAAYLMGRLHAWAAQAREQRLLIFVPWLLALLLVAACRAGAAPGKMLATAALSTPLALFVAPLAVPTRPGVEGATYLLAVAIVALSALALRRVSGYVVVVALSATTATLLVLDQFFGSPLLARSPLSYSVLEAARFYGIGNEASGVLLGASLVAGAASGMWGTALVGLIVACVLAAPGLGADFGGLVATTAGFGSLVLFLSRRRVSGRWVAALATLGVASIVVAVLWDTGRGAGARTHVGQAVASARERGAGALGEIAARKAAMGARLLVTSPWSALLAAEIGTGVWLWRRRGVTLSLRERSAARALAVAGTVALLINDSGVVAAATTLLYGVSGLILWETKRAEGSPLRPEEHDLPDA